MTPDDVWTHIAITPSCWLWQRGKMPFGYGVAIIDGTQWYLHRWVYEQLVGPIPVGLQIDHLCRVPACCNPDHLEPVTRKENVLRGTAPSAVNARRTECVNGHPFDEANTRILPDGRRRCRACTRERQRGYQRARSVSISRTNNKEK